MAAEDTPPRRRRRTSETPQESPTTPRTEAKEEPPKPPGKPIGVLQKKLEMFLVGMALPFAAAGDTHCATIFAERGPIVAEAWANLAAESPAVKRVLESMLRGGAWAGAIGSTLALAVPVAAHHGVSIPDPITPILFGRHASTTGETDAAEPVDESQVIFHAPPADSSNGTPGPAAVSLPTRDDGGLTDPRNYPGPHNDEAVA